MPSLALVAHDQKKDQMIAWVKAHEAALEPFRLYATGTTGGRIVAETGLRVERLKSGPLGGDAQIGAMIAEGKLDALVFFIDPLSALPHDVDVKSLLRLAILYDTLLAVNEATASRLLEAAATGSNGSETLSPQT
ncbi:methylglyoxal synthase [Roseobacter sinensis]|uniref:Methylglyoxal synthase n=1 Tax=Roseobacter sinensis TaxID=2931391 RepID=A0ABT3BGU1_9RHOB|nr:methylglyoxal synthase [Roseobacter sp. WL0113]MCV3272762.1 methylglyoxal synthase [Roseobacter sp. WL0113]